MGSDKSESDPLAPFLKSMGEDCDRPACDDTKSALTAALGRVNAAKNKKSNDKQQYVGCPPSKDEIGVSTWNLLHSMVSFRMIVSRGFNTKSTIHEHTGCPSLKYVVRASYQNYRRHGIPTNHHHKTKSLCPTL